MNKITFAKVSCFIVLHKMPRINSLLPLLRMDTEQQRCWCYEMRSFAVWCHICKVKQSGTTNQTMSLFCLGFLTFLQLLHPPKTLVGPNLVERNRVCWGLGVAWYLEEDGACNAEPCPGDWLLAAKDWDLRVEEHQSARPNFRFTNTQEMKMPIQPCRSPGI